MSNYIKHLMERMWPDQRLVGVDVSQHRRYTTRYEDLCM